ncbi:mucin-binding protein [uncultured Lactobacillus sp.]|uniref:mucin-binding protein n=1 Tax=uncultured Lactobacillus sp. TaxID=153152 RepID=UPI00262A274D|nr:YSIRK-type signal peptide-containing protein [uncultured Lactobacillus sp.]
MMQQEQHPRFSIRKLTIGAVSVMFGLVLFGNQNQVHAATTNENDKDASAAVKADDKDTTSQSNVTILKTKSDNSVESTTEVKDSQGATASNDKLQTKQVAKSEAPKPGEDYNAEYKKNADALYEDPKTKNANESKPSFVDKNGVETKLTISAKNKNNGKESTVEVGPTSKNIVYNSGVATDANVTITITNPTDKTQPITGYGDYAYIFPTWHGDNNFAIDSDRTGKDAQGSITFGGNYTEQGLTLGGFSLANPVGSTGFGKSAVEAAQDPSKIGGFTVSGNLAAGKTATIVVPFKYKDPTSYPSIVTSDQIGIWYKTGVNQHHTEVETTLDNQIGKDYFLVDITGVNASTRDLHSVPQTVIDALVKDGLYPTYQKGDAQVNNFSGDTYQPGNDDYLTAGAQVNLTGPYKRLADLLKNYGYKLGDYGRITNVPNGYYYHSDFKFYDAQGKQIKLGTGNISNFFIPVEQVISQNSDSPTLLQAQMPGDDDQTYIQEVKNMFTPDSVVDTSKIDIHKAGAYPVKVSKDGTSRIYNVVVFNTYTPDAYKTNDRHHKDLTADSIIFSDSEQLLKDNHYTVEWVQAPDYTKASDSVPVIIKIVDADGRAYEVKDHVNVQQKITVNFTNEGKTVDSFDLYSYADGRNTLGRQVTTDDQSAKARWDDVLSKLQKDYVINESDLKQALATKFLSQADDQTLEIKLGKNSTGTPLVDPAKPTVEQRSQNYTRTINYVDENGKQLKDPTVQTVTVTKLVSVDPTTKKETDLTKWSTANFDEVTLPKIDGYFTTEKDIVKAPATKDETVTIHYTKKQSATGDALVDPAKPAVEQRSQDYTRTIKYVDENGKQLKDPTVQTVTVTKLVSVDPTTKKETDLTKWSTANFDAVKLPKIDGYFTTDKDVAKEAATKDETITIHYAKKHSATGEPLVDPEKPVYPIPQPEPQPTPDPQPNIPDTDNDNTSSDVIDVPAPHGEDQPTKPETDNEETVKPHASVVPTATNVVAVNTSTHVAVSHSASAAKSAQDDSTVRPLPQTGAKQNNASLIGLAIAGVASLFGIAADRKKKN